MSKNINGTYVSEKINKIRWRPDPFNNSHSFVTGSWDNDTNNIKLWDFQENIEDSDIYPYVISNFPFEGDVTECKFLNPDLLIASSSLGSVYQIRVNVNERGTTEMSEDVSWKGIHKFDNNETSSCTSFAIYDRDIASIGEEGSIHLLTASRRQIVRKIPDADSCSLKCIIFLKHNELLTGNLRGQMKIWDLRSSENSPRDSFLLGEDQIASTTLAFHPTQRHLVVAGDEQGSITVWDLRQSTYPVNLLNAHEDSVSELQFHPEYPDQLFSCSVSGELWHWMANKQHGLLVSDNDGESDSWIMGDSIKNKVKVHTVMSKLHKPVNSLDVNRNRVLCGCDNEAIYLISDVNVYA